MWEIERAERVSFSASLQKSLVSVNLGVMGQFHGTPITLRLVEQVFEQIDTVFERGQIFLRFDEKNYI